MRCVEGWALLEPELHWHNAAVDLANRSVVLSTESRLEWLCGLERFTTYPRHDLH